MTITADSRLRYGGFLLMALLAACGSASKVESTSSGSSNSGSTPPPVTNPSKPTSIMGQAAAARLLMQGTMGVSRQTLQATAAQTYDAWFSSQAAAPVSLSLPLVTTWNGNESPAWWYNATNGTDQLRLRMAFALSEIFVVSSVNQKLDVQGQGLAYFYDQLSRNALGNFRTLLEAVSRSPEMGVYLTYFQNDKPSPVTGVHADENFAREIMQLFTIGLWRLNADGTQSLDSSGNPVATYSQGDITNMARIFTGWASAQANTSGEAAWTHDPDYLNPMACYASHHDADAKVILENVPIPAGGTCDSDLKVALDTLFNHPNTGPFIAKQLIQRLVTSNPSPAYVGRVSAVFANDGAGVRGNLLAVSKAILTDSEAINVSASADSGRLSEPMLRLTALWRAFSATAKNGLVADQVIGNASSDFGENAVSSPTVFNFFTPSFRQSGAIADAGLVSPEFQIVNENTIVLTANALLEQSYKFVGSTGKAEIGVDSVVGDGPPNDGDMVLHTAAWEADAADAANLVDQLGLVLMPGRLSDPMRSTLVAYVNDIPATSPANRVVETVALMINSPQYAVQR